MDERLIKLGSLLLYHGTTEEFADLIDVYGLSRSMAGFGQAHLEGVALIQDFDEAARYARSHARLHRDFPAILTVRVPSGVWYDARGFGGGFGLVENVAVDLGLDPESEEFFAFLRGHDAGLGDLVMEIGAEGIIIDSTIRKGHAPEYVWFNWKKLETTRCSPSTPTLWAGDSLPSFPNGG